MEDPKILEFVITIVSVLVLIGLYTLYEWNKFKKKNKNN